MKKILSAILVTLTLLASSAAQAAEGGGLRVAVVDTGISTRAVSSDSILPGKNYVLPDGNTEDKLGHGTAVSAIIVGSQAARILGICPEAKLVPLVTATQDENGNTVQGDTATAAKAIRDAVDHYGCRIINVSSGAASSSWQLRNAVAYAQEQGALVISSAGNNQKSNPGAVYYPGGYDGVLCVGAANENGSIASYSQQNDTVDLLALGSMRVATIKGTRINAMGTSYSTAIVTGAAAQIWSEHPDLTAEEVRAAVLDCTRTVEGWQVLDLDAVLAWTPNATPFTDVAPGDECYDAVCWSADSGIVNGATPTTFDPNGTMTRAHMVTILWRAQGCPEPNTVSCPFADVDMNDYYGKAVLWAVEQGLINGVTHTTFAPNQHCTRAHMITLLHRVSGRPAVTGEGIYADVADGTWYHDAVLWGAQLGIVTEIGEFFPHQDCTRAQMVTWLYRCFGE